MNEIEEDICEYNELWLARKCQNVTKVSRNEEITSIRISLITIVIIHWFICLSSIGKARRLKQAKDEATEEIEKYRGEREKQFKDFEVKVWHLNLCTSQM